MLFVANWKMYLTPCQTKNLFKQFTKTFASHTYEKSIVICPSMSSLYMLHNINTSKIRLGAQNSSPYQLGPYTGEESPETLASINCNFCIVGHSERKKNNAETLEKIQQKASALIKHNIIPIICIGETLAEFEKNKTQETLLQQLSSILSLESPFPIYVAYEPIWAIGTGKTPSQEFLFEIFAWLHNIRKESPNNLVINFLYGGSVKGSNASNLSSVKNIDGFLVGGASLDSQEFEKIVNCSLYERNLLNN